MVPSKSIERLIAYRSLLKKRDHEGQEYIFSHQLGELSGHTAAQVRRDLMAVGYSGNSKNGYHIQDLLSFIKQLLEPTEGISVILSGVGNLGRAILSYFATLRPLFNIIAGFDVDPQKTDRVIHGCRIYSISDFSTITQQHPSIQLGILTVPAPEAQAAADLLISAGVCGLINFSPVRIKTPEHVYVEHMDMALTFEKVAFIAREKTKRSEL